jgi:ATP-dependent helicase/nuclease subunit B
MRRWAVDVDDTQGEKLAARGVAQLVNLIATYVLSDFSVLDLVAVLHDTHSCFGMDAVHYARAKQVLEILVLRRQGVTGGPDGLRQGMQRAELALAEDANRNGTKLVSDEDWRLVVALVQRIETAFSPWPTLEPALLGAHVERLRASLELVCDESTVASREMMELLQALQEIADVQHLLPNVTFAESVPLILAKLKMVAVRVADRPDGAIAIYGLLEARLMRFDVAVLGGLNEGLWPASPNPGPWLNRPMRDAFHLQQPERDIGLTAHDFVAGLGHQKIHLTWTKRIGTEPAIASRWVLRLRTVMEASGIAPKQHCDTRYVDLAKAIDHPYVFQSRARPWPRPPVPSRPRKFSVTEIERLIRDPYAVYVRKMLRLQPCCHWRRNLMHDCAAFCFTRLSRFGTNWHRRVKTRQNLKT